jgi:hypothetical protein
MTTKIVIEPASTDTHVVPDELSPLTPLDEEMDEKPLPSGFWQRYASKGFLFPDETRESFFGPI